ncbi:pyrroline-5-carboxylate reductase 1, mitochondrial-like [Lytechinus variegatus]|uniref:pyrroline-5-carboxylate reductase 1, mitochondrial-like n=1 Tax=Lytechinus variegatus TaxID=7654 RepID=UPI001BB23D30|nr:pyrroline-5-carboxylate reductase 1, mitochondrial-like [Lytechinus variegatus]
MSLGTVGFIGAGKIAQTITKGLLAANAVAAERIVASDPASHNLKVLSDLGTKTATNNEQLLQIADTIFLATKPNIVGRVLKEISPHIKKDHLLISLAAGITLDYLESSLPDETRVIRAMPNTPSIIMEGATIFSVGRNVQEGDGKMFQSLISQLGICLEGDETLIDAAMSVSGCGPAYAYVAIDALADGGVKMGLPRDVAIKLSAQALLGSSKMVLTGGKHPSQLKDEVCSPAGTTIDAIHELEKGGFRRCLIEAVEAACLKARRLNAMQLYDKK